MITKAKYVERRTASLQVLDVEISKLLGYADAAPPDVSLKFSQAIETLRSARHAAARKLQELQAFTEDEWVLENAQQGVESAWRDLRNAILFAISVTYHC